jgi:hypothetical protein
LEVAQIIRSNSTEKFNDEPVNVMTFAVMAMAHRAIMASLISQPLLLQSARASTPLEKEQLVKELASARKKLADLENASRPSTRKEVLPLWTMQQYIDGPVGSNTELCFGSSMDAELYQTLQSAMDRSILFGQA